LLTLSVHTLFSSFILSLLNFTETWAMASSEPDMQATEDVAEVALPESTVPEADQRVKADWR